MIAHRNSATRHRFPLAFAICAAAVSLPTMAASPVQAAQREAFYAAALSRPMEGQQRVIQKGILWQCAGAQCSAPRDASRPAMVCARLARKVGPVVRFATPQGTLVPAELARCNAAAPG